MRRRLTSSARGLKPRCAADNREQQPAVEQPLGDATCVLVGHRVDQAVAAGYVIDAEIVKLDLHQLGRDLGRCVEVERIGALQVCLRLGDLVGATP